MEDPKRDLETAQNIYQLMENEFPAPTGESIDKVFAYSLCPALNSFDEVHGGLVLRLSFQPLIILLFFAILQPHTNERVLQMVEKTLLPRRWNL